MTITAERPAPASLDIEQLREHRRALDIEIAHVATEWSKAWYDYVPQCPWAAVNERVMATPLLRRDTTSSEQNAIVWSAKSRRVDELSTSSRLECSLSHQFVQPYEPVVLPSRAVI